MRRKHELGTGARAEPATVLLPYRDVGTSAYNRQVPFLALPFPNRPTQDVLTAVSLGSQRLSCRLSPGRVRLTPSIVGAAGRFPSRRRKLSPVTLGHGSAPVFIWLGEVCGTPNRPEVNGGGCLLYGLSKAAAPAPRIPCLGRFWVGAGHLAGRAAAAARTLRRSAWGARCGGGTQRPTAGRASEPLRQSLGRRPCGSESWARRVQLCGTGVSFSSWSPMSLGLQEVRDESGFQSVLPLPHPDPALLPDGRSRQTEAAAPRRLRPRTHTA